LILVMLYLRDRFNPYILSAVIIVRILYGIIVELENLDNK